MARSVTINLLKFIPWKLPSLSTLGLKNFCTQTTDKIISDKRVNAGKTEMNTENSGCPALTASREQLACSMHRLLRDQTKLKVSG